MLKLGFPLRVPHPAGLVAGALGLAGLAAVLILSTSGEGELRFTAVPRLELPLPDGPWPAGRPPLAPAAAPDGTPHQALHDLDPALIEDGAYGPLPRIGPDGQQPLVAYARPFDLADPRPRIAILLTGLGLQAEITAMAMTLPAAVSLGFSPYAADLGRLLEEARRVGHEVFIELPMEPVDYPESDPGPKTLLAGVTPEENRDRLLWVLARGAGYVGVAGAAGRFGGSPQALPAARLLAERGLGLIEVGAGALAQAAAAAGLAYASSASPVDENPAAVAIDYALAGLEAQALESGRALGVAQLYPVTLERLRQWAASLVDKGLVLAPASALLIEQARSATREPPDQGSHAAARG